MKKELLDRLEDLSNRVLAGEVVFFVGAGFSLDSEGNSSSRLVKRLLARFLAMYRVLSAGTLLNDNKKVGEDLKSLYTGLKRTFFLPEDFEHFDQSDKVQQENFDKLVGALTGQYYLLNDWMCSAYSEILGHLAKPADVSRHHDDLLKQIAEQEDVLLDRFSAGNDKVKLATINLDRLNRLEAKWRGKALFLDTMGFGQPEVMGGSPDEPTIEAVVDSYRSLLHPRHHILARMAREGLCPILVTTNFDLLLEGAYRLAGFLPLDRKVEDVTVPPTRWPTFTRITQANQFYYRPPSRRKAGTALRGGQQSATLVKIHGCADTYRHACATSEGEVGTLETVLSSLVFTFREIQNWRQDSWSRDQLLTLLRTRTMVFCSYSAADPVLHDTIRNVYEEMAARAGSKGRCLESEVPETTDAPAFFLGGVTSGEFHGLEVLRAASRAVGVPEGNISLTSHKNYLGFHFRSNKESFPHIDEILAWTFHRVYRKRQRQALESELRSIASLLLEGNGPTDTQVKEFIERFDAFCEKEKKAVEEASKTTTATEARDGLERIIGWTTRFHPQFLRELALADLRQHRSDLSDAEARKKPWYFPAGENFSWTAWGVVVELALRRIVAALVGNPELWNEPRRWASPSPWLETAPDVLPVVEISPNEERPLPFSLSIRFGTSDPLGQQSPAHGLLRKRVFWTLTRDRLPWSTEDVMTPDARSLWEWACLEDGSAIIEELKDKPWFTEFHEKIFPSDSQETPKKILPGEA
ncbi:MAG: SIR2 family protein [Alphaproteobacteria bacterium]